MSMKVKSCELDPLPAKVFRRFSKELTPIVAHVVNISIRNCFFSLGVEIFYCQTTSEKAWSRDYIEKL